MIILRYVLTGLALILLACALFTALYSWWVGHTYPPTGSFVSVESGRLHYVDKAPSGEPAGTIVVLHGASSNLEEAMLGIGNRLPSRYRIIAFDRPGFGWSDRIGGAESAKPAQQAAILADGMRKLGVRDAVVVGHSWAGAILPNLALDHRDVTGAILDLAGATHPWPDGKIDWYYTLSRSWIGWLFTRTITTPVGLAIFDRATESVFTPQVMPSGFIEDAHLKLILRPTSFYANGQDIGALYDAVTEQSPRYKDIRVPTTIIGGDADKVVWTDLHSRSLAREVPSAKLIILPGVGHMLQYAAPDLVIDEIEALATEVARAQNQPLASERLKPSRRVPGR